LEINLDLGYFRYAWLGFLEKLQKQGNIFFF